MREIAFSIDRRRTGLVALQDLLIDEKDLEHDRPPDRWEARLTILLCGVHSAGWMRAQPSASRYTPTKRSAPLNIEVGQRKATQ
jgi:hypothetical protein